jgi:putative ubiquitin-RnfH superfamily antitoxin RatB of RatAB toxin-antitoxin module
VTNNVTGAEQDSLVIEVVYGTPAKQQIMTLSVEQGCSVFDGAVRSGIQSVFPEIDFDTVHMGLFGKVVKTPKDTLLREGDRIEIYRPLLIDPKQARLNRAAKKAAG